jgi:hypothetical protein
MRAELMERGDAAVGVAAEEGYWGSISFIDYFQLTRIDGFWKHPTLRRGEHG